MPWLELLTALACVLAADQLSKQHVLSQARFATRSTGAYVSIRCIVNRQAALVAYSETWVVTGWILCAALAFFVLDQDAVADSALGTTGLGLVLGGVTSNVIDLLWRRGIVDFIALRSWTIFNLADVAILGGLALTVLALA